MKKTQHEDEPVEPQREVDAAWAAELDRRIRKRPLTLDALGRRLRVLREASSMTHEEVAAALGVSASAVLAIEEGTRLVNGIELDKLAYLFCRDIRELVADEIAEPARAPSRRPAESVEEMRARIASELRVRSLEEMLGVAAGTKSLRELAVEAHERELITTRKLAELVRIANPR